MSVSTRSGKLTRMVITAVLAAVATVLMVLEISVPFMPPFLKLDFSELPALIAAFSMGPLNGVLVCLIKNILHLPLTQTGGIGELSNFLLGVLLIIPAGWIYRICPNLSGATIGALAGSLSMALVGVLVNAFIIYPLYARLLIPMDAILAMYRSILPFADNLWKALFIFNLPFTFGKGLIGAILAILLMKPLRSYLSRHNI